MCEDIVHFSFAMMEVTSLISDQGPGVCGLVVARSSHFHCSLQTLLNLANCSCGLRFLRDKCYVCVQSVPGGLPGQYQISERRVSCLCSVNPWRFAESVPASRDAAPEAD